MRWALRIEYDGTGLIGWQRQENGLAVQEILETAAARLDGRTVGSVVAGRTDAGVHALGQVAHIDLDRAISAPQLASALNFHMRPHAVSVLRAAAVTPDFSARFSAKGRAYRYDILNRPARPALALNRVWHITHPLDENAMHAAAQLLLGRHDFTSFRAAACQANSPVRSLEKLDVQRQGDMVRITAEARSFLHHQVRNMVGTLVQIGRGLWPVESTWSILEARDRRQAGATAPPMGLFLTSVRYDADPFSAGAISNTSVPGDP